VTTGLTRRQEIVERLRDAEWAFDDLRHDLELTVRVLEEDLRHIDRSVRATGSRLELRSARCEVCDFVFKSTAFHPPGRCPSCRDRRIAGPWLRVRR
jgi:predicted Zn-ribbon and HTH transcriptional regulator